MATEAIRDMLAFFAASGLPPYGPELERLIKLIEEADNG